MLSPQGALCARSAEGECCRASGHSTATWPIARASWKKVDPGRMLVRPFGSSHKQAIEASECIATGYMYVVVEAGDLRTCVLYRKPKGGQTALLGYPV